MNTGFAGCIFAGWFFAAVLAPAASVCADDAALSPGLAYQARRGEPVAHEIDFRVVVTPPYHCKLLKVWLPLPQSDAGQEISGGRLSTFPERVEPVISTEPLYGNKFAYFEFHEPHGAQIIRHRFTARIRALNWDVDPRRVQDVEKWPEPFAPYLAPQPIEEQQQFDKLLGRIVPQRTGEAGDLRKVMSWIDEHMTYDHVNASLKADADFAFTRLRGHCSDYHGLCATMARRLGYPTRVTYGLSLVPKNSPSHCKLEAFLPPYGWVSYDLSETQKLVRQIQTSSELNDVERQALTEAAHRRLQSGFRENSWLLLTRGTDYDLSPKASQRVAVVRTIYAEADGVPLPDPDPANAEKREFAWMTAHRYTADRPFELPFKDISTLQPYLTEH